jgi:hypothetical protein
MDLIVEKYVTHPVSEPALQCVLTCYSGSLASLFMGVVFGAGCVMTADPFRINLLILQWQVMGRYASSLVVKVSFRSHRILVSCAQVWHYFSSRPNDSATLKTAVSSLGLRGHVF